MVVFKVTPKRECIVSVREIRKRSGTDLTLMGIEMVLCPFAGENLKHGLESKVLSPNIFFFVFLALLRVLWDRSWNH